MLGASGSSYSDIGSVTSASPFCVCFSLVIAEHYILHGKSVSFISKKLGSVTEFVTNSSKILEGT